MGSRINKTCSDQIKITLFRMAREGVFKNETTGLQIAASISEGFSSERLGLKLTSRFGMLPEAI